MTAIKSHEFDGFLRRQGTPYRIILVYGPDRGLVSERASFLAARTGVDLADDFSVLKIEASDINSDPGRLADEFSAISLFGGDRLVWVRNAGNERGLVDALSALSEMEAGRSHLLIEAGDLKKGSALRKLAEGARTILAIPCYPDEARGIQGLIDEEMEKAGLGITAHARARLASLLGSDRLSTRSELKKLALYCHGLKTVEEDHVLAAIGDAAALSVDDAVDAAFEGDTKKLELALERILSSRTPVFQALRSVLQTFEQIDVMRARMENEGKPVSQIMSEMGRGIHFKRKPIIERALRQWQGTTINREMKRLADAVFETRKNPALEGAVARTALLRVCLLNRQSNR